MPIYRIENRIMLKRQHQFAVNMTATVERGGWEGNPSG